MEQVRWTAIPMKVRKIIIAGDKALERINEANKRMHDDWLAVGKACAAFRAEVAELAGGHTSGKTYTRIYQELGVHVPTLAAIEPTTRSRAIWVYEKWNDGVGDWYEALDVSQQLVWNHPGVIERAFEAHAARELKARAGLLPDYSKSPEESEDEEGRGDMGAPDDTETADQWTLAFVMVVERGLAQQPISVLEQARDWLAGLIDDINVLPALQVGREIADYATVEAIKLAASTKVRGGSNDEAIAAAAYGLRGEEGTFEEIVDGIADPNVAK